MHKQLINTLLSICHSDGERFNAGKGLTKFCALYNIGQTSGAGMLFSQEDKQEIARVLQGQMGIDVATTTSASWGGLSRSESLTLAKDEKLAGGVVNQGRVLVKALSGRAVKVCGGQWALCSRSDMGFDVAAILAQGCGHDSLLIVENKQTFHDLWDVRLDLTGGHYSADPLVVFRGEAEEGARVDATHALIRGLDLPVAAFVDYDPAGMVIAASLPRLDRLVSPPLDELVDLLKTRGLTDRFLEQLPKASKRLEELVSHPIVGSVCQVIMKHGKAFPQEAFCRSFLPPSLSRLCGGGEPELVGRTTGA